MRLPVPFSAVLPGEPAPDFPLISLVCANLVTIALAILESWDLATVMFIYLVQSIIIGFFTVVSLLTADTSALSVELEKPIREQGGNRVVTKRFAFFYQCFLAGFFTVHYGLFHFGYFSFVVESGIFGTVAFSDTAIWLSCAFFFANHLYSFLVYRKHVKGAADFTEIFFSPYQRIIPMHLTIIFGSIVILALEFLGIPSTLPVLVLFLVLKTYTDIQAHLIKHERERKPDAPVRFF